MIKDKLNIYNNYYDLDVRCYSCNYFNHVSLKCPMVHVIINPERVLRFYTECFWQKRDPTFWRGKTLKSNSLVLLKKSLESIKKLYKSVYFTGEFSFDSVNSFQNANFMSKNNMNSNNISEKPFELDNDSILCSIDDIKSVPELRLSHYDEFVDNDELCSIDKDLENNSEMAGITKSTKKDKTRNKINEKEFQILLNDSFHFAFEKMKNYEIYFSHNNAESIVEKIKNLESRRFSENEKNLIKFLNKKTEKEKRKSCQTLQFQNIFFNPKLRLDFTAELKIRTSEILAMSPSKSKKVRQSGHQMVFKQIVKQEPKLSGMSKKIVKKRKWLCFECQKMKYFK